MKKKTALIISLILLGISSLKVAKLVRAQEADEAIGVVKLAAYPPRAEDLMGDPGEVVTREIKVRNMGETEMNLQVKVVDFIVENNQGTPIMVSDGMISQEDNRWAMSQWTNASPTRFVLKPGEIKALDVVVVIPEDALPGGHYAAVLYEPVGNVGMEESGAKVIPTVATLLYLTVNGDINEEAFVSRMDIPSFSEYGPISIETEIENLSDIHIKPMANIRIYNLFGRLATTLGLEELNIFPGRARVFNNTWQRKWLFGRYKAQLEGTFGSQGQALLATAYFWVIPWKVILIALLTIALATALVIYFKKKKQVVIEEKEDKKE